MLCEVGNQHVNIVRGGLPCLIQVNHPIIMGDDIAHPTHASKRQAWKQCLAFRRQTTCGFAYDFEPSQYGLLLFHIGHEICTIHSQEIRWAAVKLAFARAVSGLHLEMAFGGSAFARGVHWRTHGGLFLRGGKDFDGDFLVAALDCDRHFVTGGEEE